ncbi:MAG TPA: hypothetical protein PKX46_06730 [Clostridia bacterium]|nr:hypothetical protein [Clostridia bacterium]
MDGLTVGLTILATLSGVILGWTGRARDVKKDTKDVAEDEATLKSDLAYVKRGVDDIRLDLRAQGQKMDNISERLTRCEESTKQAHKRLDGMAS